MNQDIAIFSLGCSKNLVDTEKLMYQLQEVGYNLLIEPNLSNYQNIDVIINTCGFILDAQEESVNTILLMTKLKEQGHVKRIIVMGCLSQRYAKELKEEIPEIDAIYGKFDLQKIIQLLQPKKEFNYSFKRVLTTPSHYAYLKIAEGCNHKCAYCAIPLMTGNYKSRPIEEVLEETKYLVSQGVKEFQVIAQDITYYGRDLYKQAKLPELIEKMAAIKGVEWIRIHYGYPSNFPFDLLRVIRENDNVCNYLDLAFQHISESVLKRMRRPISSQEIYDLIKRIRKEVPGICLRTTLITGFPGETEEDYKQLIEFVKEIKFEKLGAFSYSNEEGTYAYTHYEDDIDETTKKERTDFIMRNQYKIMEEKNIALIGKTIKVIIDEYEIGVGYIGRTEYDSPEVDMTVIIDYPKEGLVIGNFYNIKITKCNDVELYGEIVS